MLVLFFILCQLRTALGDIIPVERATYYDNQLPHLMSPRAGGFVCELWLLISSTFVSARGRPRGNRLTSSVTYLCATLEPNKRKCQWDTAQMDKWNSHRDGDLRPTTWDSPSARKNRQSTRLVMVINKVGSVHNWNLKSHYIFLSLSLQLSLDMHPVRAQQSDFRFLWDLPAKA